MALRTLLCALALAPLACARATKEAPMPAITYAKADAAWSAALRAAVAHMQPQLSGGRRAARRIHAAPVGPLRFFVEIGFSPEEAGPMSRTRMFVLDGQVVQAWTPERRVAALRQAGLPAHRPPAALLARFLESTGLFGDTFPGVYDDFTGQLREGVSVQQVGAAVQIDYEGVAGRGGGVDRPILHRLTVHFDGQALRVERATR